MYASNELASMNATARTSGAVGADPVTVRYLKTFLDGGELVLDFGAGPSRRHANQIEGATGAIVEAFDTGANWRNEYHVRQIEAGRYDVAYASNVLNVQPHSAGIVHVLTSMRRAVHSAGVIFFNFPKSPRKFSGFDDGDLIALCGRLGMVAQRVPGHAGLFMAMIGG